jgi:hypothetical protein
MENMINTENQPHDRTRNAPSPYRDIEVRQDTLSMDIRDYARILVPYASTQFGEFVHGMEMAINHIPKQRTYLFGSGPRRTWDVLFNPTPHYVKPTELQADAIPMYMQTQYFQRSAFGLDPQADAVRGMITTGSGDYDTKSDVFDTKISYKKGVAEMKKWFRESQRISPNETQFRDPVDPTLFQLGLDGYCHHLSLPPIPGEQVASIRKLQIPNNPKMEIVIVTLGKKQDDQVMNTFQIHATGTNEHDLRFGNPDNPNWQNAIARVLHHYTDHQILVDEDTLNASRQDIQFPDALEPSEKRVVSFLQSVFRAARFHILRQGGLNNHGVWERYIPSESEFCIVPLELPDEIYTRINQAVDLVKKANPSDINQIQTDILAELGTIALWNPIALGEILLHTDLRTVLTGLYDMNDNDLQTVSDEFTRETLIASGLPRFTDGYDGPIKEHHKEIATGFYQHKLLLPFIKGTEPDWSDFRDGLEYWMQALHHIRKNKGIPLTDLMSSSDPVVQFCQYFRFIGQD